MTTEEAIETLKDLVGWEGTEIRIYTNRREAIEEAINALKAVERLEKHLEKYEGWETIQWWQLKSILKGEEE